MKRAAIRLLVVVVLILLLICLFVGQDVTVEMILAYTPKEPWLAALVLWMMYGFKSATLFIPVIVLEIAGGHLFSIPVALAVNFIGTLIILSIPYCIGRHRGADAVKELTAKYPKLQRFTEKQRNNDWFLCFFLRIISCLPGDVVTLYLGATNVPYRKNLLGGVLGLLPGMVLATVLGASMEDPSSPAFWISICLTGLLSALSILLYYVYQRKKGGRNE